jgi:isopentenyl diphosphate isomerase/L-lactate dehydrogenase-like FMN-dependent dehydrogenase
VNRLIEELIRTLRIVMFCVGASNIAALQATPPIKRQI